MIEIVIITIISIIYIILLTFILKAYYNDTESMEIRILQLEKRVNRIDKDLKFGYEYQEEQIQELFLILKNEVIEKENNTQESGEDCMPCGRKKGRGGKRK